MVEPPAHNRSVVGSSPTERTISFCKINIIPGSSMVECSAVNRDVIGSNPIRGAIRRDTEVVITALP